MSIRRIVRWIACTALAAQCLPMVAQALPAVPEYKLKAAFVYNFALFTDWPAGVMNEGGTINLCINPDSALRPALAELGDKSIKGRRVAVRLLTDPDAVRGCHVVFLDTLDREHWSKIKKGLGNANALTVSDDGEIGHDGAVITLYVDNNRMAFDIDMNAARQARLTLSSKLLRLARTVR